MLKILFLFSIFLNSEAAEVDAAIKKLNALTQLRERLASTLDTKKDKITIEIFKQVCAPVGMGLKSWAKENGYQAKQVSQKYRNPLHKPSPSEEKVLAKFTKDKSLKEIAVPGKLKDINGTHLYLRINVTSSCLHCHGAKNTRPEFVLKKYNDDKAYDFKPGDLRGMYSVFIPKKKL